jgi:hypothetical protein
VVPLLPLAVLAAVERRLLTRAGRYPTAASAPDAPAANYGPFGNVTRLVTPKGVWQSYAGVSGIFCIKHPTIYQIPY